MASELETFPDGFIVLTRQYTFTQLAEEAVQELDLFESFCLAGLAYAKHLETSQNPLLKTRYGKAMRSLDPVSRKSFAQRIIHARWLQKRQKNASLLDVPVWWIKTDPDVATGIDHT